MSSELQQSEQVIFHGSVQGVGFRWTCQRLARELELRGWVRNLPDGTVELVAQGGREPIRLLIERLMLEPGRIRITQAEQRKLELPAISGFSVR